MNTLRFQLPTPGEWLSDEALAGMIERPITVRDLEGQPHPGRVLAAERVPDQPEAIMVTVETSANIPGSEPPLMVSIGDDKIVPPDAHKHLPWWMAPWRG